MDLRSSLVIKVYFIILLLLSSNFLNAFVDTKNANYSNTWTDIIVPGSGYDLRVMRTYNSRSLYKGLFGFGWCSDFETRVVNMPDGTIKLIECGGGMELVYSTKALGAKDLEAQVASIITESKKKNKQSEGYYQSLTQNLKKDINLRLRLSAELGLNAKIKEGITYFANGKEVDTITFSKDSYTRRVYDGSSQKFDKEGRLTYMYDKNGNFLKLDYEKGKLREVSDNNNRRLLFKYNTNQQIATIIGPNNITVEYKFANLDHLSWVNNAWGNINSYEYDESHNMTKAIFPDKTTVQVTYDRSKDWVIGLKDRSNCTDKYSYEVAKDDPKNHYWSTVKRTCGKEVSDSKFEFIHKVRSDGVTYLARTITTVNNVLTDITYHEIFGKPIHIKRNADITAFEYFANGLLKAKSNNVMKLAYEYDKENNKVSKVRSVFFDPKGKKIAEKASEFKYDKKNNLIFAKNTDGQKINLTYDLKGRIDTIEDQAKKLVKISYDDKFGKPALVTRPNLGTIKISYKQNGEIDKAESPDGPKVAIQVASAFNNLLDIIAPASSEIYN